MNALFIIGASGVGKTALADALALDCDWIAFHGGRRLINWAQSQDKPDLLDDIHHQRPVPAPLFLDLVENVAASIQNYHVVFDGFPRSLEHLSAVDRVCEILSTSAGPRNAMFLILRAPDSVVRARRASRFECPNCGATGRGAFECISCKMQAISRPPIQQETQEGESEIAKIGAVLDGQPVHLWELDNTYDISITLSTLKRLLGVSNQLDASGALSYLPSLVLPPASKRVVREVNLFVDALRLADVRRFFHQRYFEEEGRAAEYSDRIEPLPKLENVASHSWHVADGVLLFGPRMPDINYEHALQLAVLHDKMEMFIGDKDPIGRDGTGRKAHAFNSESKERKRELEEIAIMKYVSRLPEPTRTVQYGLLQEALRCESPEALFVKSIDKLAALAFILVKKEGRTTNKHVNLLHALTLRNITFYPPMAEHHREILRRIVSSVAQVRNVAVEELCNEISNGQPPLF
jgi:5'-deoxynucleotidase YfbR-like HD superfamily hydrolase/adenylate kinase family enzyme